MMSSSYSAQDARLLGNDGSSCADSPSTPPEQMKQTADEEMSRLKAEVIGLKAENSGLKTEVSGLKTEVGRLSEQRAAGEEPGRFMSNFVLPWMHKLPTPQASSSRQPVVR